MAKYLEVWRALYIGKDQGVQVHSSLIPVELKLQLSRCFPVPVCPLKFVDIKTYKTFSNISSPDKPLDHRPLDLD